MKRSCATLSSGLTVDDDDVDVLAAAAAKDRKFSFLNELPLANFERLESLKKPKNFNRENGID
jgi:hypothetical protein